MVIVELESGEIEWLGVKHVHLDYGGKNGGNAENFTYLEIKPASKDLSQLKRLRQVEQQIRSSWLNDDRPVHASAEGQIIRITWRSSSIWITPGVNRAVKQLAQILKVNIRQEKLTAKRQTIISNKDREQENRILDLAESGDTVGAVELARRLYGFSLEKALRFVKELQGRQ